MLYSNMHLYSTQTEFNFGILDQITLGESDEYGFNQVVIVCSSATEVHKGMNRNLSIEFSLSNHPKITKRKIDDLYMILSSKGGSTLKGDGAILVLEHQRNQFEVLSRAHGGDLKFVPCEYEEGVNTGYLEGSWDHLLLKAPYDNAIIQVRPSGSMYGDPPSDLYLIHRGHVRHCTYRSLKVLCSRLNIPIPCEVFPNAWGNLKLGGKWVAL